MKHLLVLFALAAPAGASANKSYVLDYRASDPSCIDSGRFSDEVSAKLGFVPWDDRAIAKIRVSVEREGASFTGTFRNTDGSGKIVEGKTCNEVTSSLVVTVATAVDNTPVKEHAPMPAVTTTGGGIPVTFKSTDGWRITVSKQTGAGYAVATNGTAAAAAYFDQVCTSPCTAGLPKGRNYLGFADPDHESAGGGDYLIDKPTTLTLTHESRHSLRMGLVIGGAAGMALGTIGVVEGGTGGVVLGSLLLSTGLTAMLASLYFHDTFTVQQSP